MSNEQTHDPCETTTSARRHLIHAAADHYVRQEGQFAPVLRVDGLRFRARRDDDETVHRFKNVTLAAWRTWA